ncbi:AAA family ATPase [Lysinibacillus sp. JNUCC-52]|uniref:AAA family ATPase n=1 Tax=Lysinibacillus sp. JNUCC-52 TaxID=2792480 RepID=UPI001937F7DE|nr:AAA family ATPase [Lysinibacillus sp. JNUCC-52]
MINSFYIKGLYGQKNTIKLENVGNLSILTGDNGSGKTTLLNLLFTVLTGDFENLFKTKFNSLEIDFDNNKRKLLSIEIKKTKSTLEVFYIFEDYEFCIEIEDVGLPWNSFSYKLIDYDSEYTDLNLEEITESGDYCFDEVLDYETAMSEDEDNYYTSTRLFDNLDELKDNYPELSFIDEIKNSILYFPTYRRIDSDIKNLLEDKYHINSPFASDIDIYRDLKNFPIDRRVIGVDDKDIEYIYQSYSKELRDFNSEGLNELLKKFIKSIIESIYENKDETRKERKNDINLYGSAAEQLIELSNKLGIGEGIDKEEINKYFESQKLISNDSKNIVDKIEIKYTESLNNNYGFVRDSYPSLVDIVNQSLKTVSTETNFFIRLITLYREHVNEQDKLLEPFRYLENGFSNFFKEKVKLNFNEKNYNISLSRPFEKLSTGEKQLITILSYIGLVLRNCVFTPLIIIDEPELSLHISWQSKLLPQLLKKKDTKFLLATHSPYVANIKYKNNLVKLGDIDEYK